MDCFDDVILVLKYIYQFYIIYTIIMLYYMIIFLHSVTLGRPGEILNMFRNKNI